jgi:hypothetical protein
MDKIYEIINKFIVKSISINPDKPLHEHFIFWLPILIFIPLALVLSFPFWCICWPVPSDYSAIVEFLKFPLFVASLAIPFTVVIGRFHGSAQRARTNRLAEQNMAFNHYFDHRKQFLEFIKGLSLPIPFNKFVTIEEPIKLYELIFPLNRLDNQDMSAPIEVVQDFIQSKVEQVYKITAPMLMEVEKGNELFENSSVFEYLNEIGSLFGLSFSDDIAHWAWNNPMNHKSKTLDTCFQAISITIDELRNFSHIKINTSCSVDVLTALRQGIPMTNAYQKFREKVDADAHYNGSDGPI